MNSEDFHLILLLDRVWLGSPDKPPCPAIKFLRVESMDFVREMGLSKFVKNLQENADIMMQACDPSM